LRYRVLRITMDMGGYTAEDVGWRGESVRRSAEGEVEVPPSKAWDGAIQGEPGKERKRGVQGEVGGE
jgi:hypothetical protein